MHYHSAHVPFQRNPRLDRQKHVIQAKGDMRRDAIGTGAFKLKNYMAGTVIELVKNPEYFLRGRPYLDGIRIYPIMDPATAFAAFRTGRVKMTAMASRGLSHAEAALVRKDMADTAVVHSHPSFMRHLLLLKVTKPRWDDIRVRKAIDLALDRQAPIKVNFDTGSIGAAMDQQHMTLNGRNAYALKGENTG